MTLVIDTPKDLEQELSNEAAQLGLPLSEYVLRLLVSRQMVDKPLLTGADLVAYWQKAGLIGSRKEIEDSQSFVRKLRKHAETRKSER